MYQYDKQVDSAAEQTGPRTSVNSNYYAWVLNQTHTCDLLRISISQSTDPITQVLLHARYPVQLLLKEQLALA